MPETENLLTMFTEKGIDVLIKINSNVSLGFAQG
jgi:hypothetical protein